MSSQSKSLKHKFWQSAQAPLAIAHRGGAGSYSTDRFKRENTIEAFRNAERMGCKYLELDVTATADNKVIVLHVTTDRFEALLHKPSAPNAKNLEQYTYKELKLLLKREIPTLTEVFKKLPIANFLIDPKTDRVVEPLAQEIVKAQAYNRVFLNSFYFHRIQKLQKILGNKVTYGLIVGRYPRAVNRKLKALQKGQYQKAGLGAIILPYRFMGERRIRMLHKQGLKAVVWTLNSRPRVIKAMRIGVDGIISDNIKVLKQTLEF